MIPSSSSPSAMLLLLLTIALHGRSSTAQDPASTANPYLNGCLQTKLEGFNRPRVCNSHSFHGECGPPPFEDYLEIRVATGNWDSATALGWLAQIILSELLGVPSTIESGKYEQSRDFYDPQARLDYKKNARADFLVTVENMTNGDCQYADKSEENYQPCAHFISEFWGATRPRTQQFIREKRVEPAQALGILGQESWYVTKFTADLDPTVDSYHGLKGEKNRHKLAKLFKRPTTWKDYCEEVSQDNCTTPDDAAQRYPDEDEEERMFVPPFFTGHFRYTEKNNCTLHPTDCTGHIANFPCGWSSQMESSLYHLEIGLDHFNGPDNTPNGYSTTQLKDMWHAANHKREHLMIMWWEPEPLYQTYLSTDAEMQPVQLKPYTLECEKALRNHLDEACDNNLTQRVGPPEAACGNPAESLTTLITGSLYDLIHDEDIPEAAVSPAYDMLRRFQISPVQLGELFDLWESSDTPRDAVCTWASNNVEFLQSLVPQSYPRVTKEKTHSSFGYAMIGVASLATLVVLVTAALVFNNRSKPSIVFAQIDFLSILLAGALLVGVGAILSSVPASDGTCTTSIWFVNVGYTVELLPLIIKVGAINRMMVAAREMRRVSLDRTTLRGAVALITLCMVIYLGFWTGFDAPQQTADYELTDSTTEQGERIVGVSYYCSGESNVWQYVAVGWNLLLLLAASVLAFQSRNSVAAFNESKLLAVLIYSHFIFVVLRCGTFLLAGHLPGETLDHLRTLIYSCDQMGTCVIYFLPKLTASDTDTFLASKRVSGIDTTIPQSNLNGSSFMANNPSSSLRFRNGSHPFENPMHKAERPVINDISTENVSVAATRGTESTTTTGQSEVEEPPVLPHKNEDETFRAREQPMASITEDVGTSGVEQGTEEPKEMLGDHQPGEQLEGSS